MSDAHNEHESAIKTPKQLVLAIIAGFVVPIICIVLLVQYVANNQTSGAGSDGQSPEAIAARLMPVADEGFTLKDANAPRQLMAGADVYKATCAACHDSGAAGAPKTGDATGWSARIAKGYDKLVANAINGINAMPAKGGNPDLDDIEVARAVVHMANLSGAKFKEPEVKQAAPVTAGTGELQNEASKQGAQVASATDPISSSPSTQAVQAVTGDNKDAGATKVSADAGKKLYEAACQACHATGAAGAPKFGDKAAWAPRLKKGADVLHANAIKGIGAMPPKGGATASDEEVKAAVDYLAASAK
ncbi:c-type cytochrome [Oxalobacteraceae bacterium R-40]|uniref:C-type cytochrome n=1 Tax=Keguizhuia sedimenti TaxID=3064264 RepID=A0ABU1BKK4_9BURK|nr:c-type cytochrome [Oxalobacteraceae bacterium R-40]